MPNPVVCCGCRHTGIRPWRTIATTLLFAGAVAASAAEEVLPNDARDALAQMNGQLDEAVEAYNHSLIRQVDETLATIRILHGKEVNRSRIDIASAIDACMSRLKDLKATIHLSNLHETSMGLPYSLETMGSWRLIASHHASDAERSVDGDKLTRWSSKTSQETGQFFEIDMLKPTRVKGLLLDSSGTEDYPRTWEVIASRDGKHWEAALTRGEGDGNLVSIPFDHPVITRYLRIRLTSSDDSYWSISELTVFGAADP